jgi:dihydropyrimidine dehydrogenase (NAD+) subunit PreA
VENCITLKELAIGAIDPRTGRAVQGFGSWTTHPNNPTRQADKGKAVAGSLK